MATCPAALLLFVLDRMPAGSRESLFFERLGLMDLGTAYPFLLELFATTVAIWKPFAPPSRVSSLT